MNLIDIVLKKVEEANEFPVVITNRDISLINSSHGIIKILENLGYEVVTFTNTADMTYGIRVYEKT